MTDRLRLAGHSVLPATNANEARALAGEARPDLVVLDLILPDGDGLVLCQSLRGRMDVPIVVVSGTQRKNDVVLALRIGADDFIGKPFDLDEFEARVGALLRRRPRSAPSREPEVARRPYRLDPARQALRVGEHTVLLTPAEYRVLALLAARPGELVRHQHIARAVWGRDLEQLGRAIDTQARRLRKKLAACPGAPRVVKHHGRGYELAPPAVPASEDQERPPGRAPPAD